MTNKPDWLPYAAPMALFLVLTALESYLLLALYPFVYSVKALLVLIALLYFHREWKSELRDREPIFHRPEHGTTRADFEAMTVADYWEVGASGTVYDRATLLDELDRRFADPAYHPMDGLELTDFANSLRRTPYGIHREFITGSGDAL